MANENHCFPIQIGKIANQWLSSSKQTKVAGITSSGIFLGLNQGHSIFISPRKYSGPVNLVLSEDDFARIPWKQEEQLEIDYASRIITFNSKQGILCLQPEKIWQAPHRADFKIQKTEQQARLRKTVNQIQLIKGDDGFSPLLSFALGNGRVSDNISSDLQAVWETIQKIRQALHSHQIDMIINESKRLIGHGRGLTPSGDDFFCGLLIVLNRWPEIFNDQVALDELNNAIVEHAFQTTTSVGASLLECATLGEADEQIISLADALMNGEVDFKQQALRLARWGHSSGADTALGLITAVQTILSNNERSINDE